MRRVQRKSDVKGKKRKKKDGVRDRKGASEGGNSGWAAGNTLTVCWMAETEFVRTRTQRGDTRT